MPQPMPLPQASISALWVYPVKSFAGISLTESPLTPQGLAHDRRWMAIDDHGLYVTQRKLAAMALITVGLNPDTGALHLHAPNQAGIKVAPSDCLQQTECRIWHSTC